MLRRNGKSLITNMIVRPKVKEVILQFGYIMPDKYYVLTSGPTDYYENGMNLSIT